MPEWLAELWWAELGGEEARSLLRVVNQPAESVLRVNLLVAKPADVLARLPVAAHVAPGLADGVVLDAPFDAHASELFAQGAIMPQSRGSMLAAHVLAPRRGDRVLDLCAAPGGKTTQLAALMDDEGELIAVERHRGRAEALRRTCRRMHARCVEVEVGDAAGSRTGRRFDRVLVDPPCSGLGTLQSRPDLRWRVDPAAIAELATLQARVLAAGGEATAPGGALVYSVCTISRSEGEDVIAGFLPAAPRTSWPRSCRPPTPGSAGRRPARIFSCCRTGTAPMVSSSLGCAGGERRRSAGGELRRPCAAVVRLRACGPAAPLTYGATVSEPPIKLGPACPGCGEPWLRPTAVPGHYRCVYCLQRYELVSVCPNCGEHSTIVRMSSTAIVACNHCQGSMLRAV